MSEVENAAPDTGIATETFTPDERAYFESRGEKEIPQEPKAEAPAAEDKKLSPAESERVANEVVNEHLDSKAALQGEDRKVNYGALAEERARRKALEEKVREHEIMQARWEERFRAAQPPQQPQKPPSPDEDIFGAVKYQDQRIAQTEQQLAAWRQQQQAAAQQAQMGQWATAQEAEFKKDAPDYDDAFAHLRDSRANELKAVWGLDDFQVQQQLSQEWRQLIVRAAQMKQNPAKFVYEAAKLRGYAKKAPQSDDAKKLDVIEHGQQASKSLSAVGGKAGGGVEVTAMDVLKMSADDFEAWKNKNPAKFRRIMGATH